MRFSSVAIAAALACTLISTQLWAKPGEFPGRKEFPKVPVMELSQLNDQLDQVTVVDTRSSYEFNTLKLKGAVNIPIAAKDFVEQIKKLKATSNKPVVFYCNGRTCYKSYLAADQAQKAGIKDVHAFDAGIFEWAMAQPNKTELLGKSPVRPNDLISAEKYSSRLLSPDAFSQKILDMDKNSMVLDIRDKYQRAGVGFYPGKERWVSLDDQKALEKFIQKAKTSKKALFIYDEVGKQVRWLQYALERNGIKEYYFMKKGAKAYYADISKFK
ncbi:MAG: rhodanese-like domain-containing protein [Gammaproteobacteria bacterium]|nr:rhodanese-like domain-containing protein [Gammaproteobacteria bacterium]MDH5799335.1 rhodanese-like domain-containing protein [Gammaproteobacteria bacterium]